MNDYFHRTIIDLFFSDVHYYCYDCLCTILKLKLSLQLLEVPRLVPRLPFTARLEGKPGNEAYKHAVPAITAILAAVSVLC